MDIALKRWSEGLRAAACAAVLLAGASAAVAAPAKPGDTITYRVEKGDNLYTLAERYFRQPGDYRVVQRLNRVANPYRLAIGSTLVIPRSVLRREPIPAIVQNFSGSVLVGPADRQRPATAGMKVQEADVIRTGPRSFVTLRLPDASTVSLPSQTSVRVATLRRTLLANSVERSFAVENGRVRANVTPMADPFSDFRISTPIASSAVRGTRFSVSFAPAEGRATSEVVEGAVDFEEKGAGTHALTTGFGSANGLTAPVALLPTPTLKAAEKVQDEEILTFAAEPLAGAARMRFQIARDAGFLDVIDEAEQDGTGATLPSLPNGIYFVRLSAIDGHGLEGMPATYSFERRLNRISTSMEAGQAGKYRQYLFRWFTPDAQTPQYRFQLASDEAGTTLLVDEPGLSTASFILTDLPSGTYYWRVMTLERSDGKTYEKWSPMEQLRVATGK